MKNIPWLRQNLFWFMTHEPKKRRALGLSKPPLKTIKTNVGGSGSETIKDS